MFEFFAGVAVTLTVFGLAIMYADAIRAVLRDREKAIGKATVVKPFDTRGAIVTHESRLPHRRTPPSGTPERTIKRLLDRNP